MLLRGNIEVRSEPIEKGAKEVKQKKQRSIVSRLLTRWTAPLARRLPLARVLVGEPHDLSRFLRTLGIVALVAALAAPAIASAA
ncbi:MAG: hypothetical protein M0C28_32790, partial [Candidatus Moduliflexus flocculans]|nr:hypothetical protein [Candidatus Moduliflexus flocculans]